MPQRRSLLLSWSPAAAVLLAITSCGGSSRPEAPTASPTRAPHATSASPQPHTVSGSPAPSAPGSPAPSASVDTRDLVSGERYLMGTIWRISVLARPDQRDAARAAIGRALDEVARLEELLSEWRTTSEISQVNAAAGRQPVRVGEEMWTCVRVGLDVARWSDGAFDISWASLRDLWDFSPESRHVPPTAEQVRARLPLWNWHNVVLDEAHHTVFLKRAGMAIGLGGIAKGYALDRIADQLHAAHFDDFLLFGGGQVRVGGRRSDRPWRVGIQHPRDPEAYFAFVEVEGDVSVSTSGDYEHTWTHEGRRYHHILDPHTGFPSELTASVTLITPSALWADAVDTAVFILGPERALRMLASAPGGPHEAVIVDPAMKLFTTPGTQRRLVMRMPIDAEGRLPQGLDGVAPPPPAHDVAP